MASYSHILLIAALLLLGLFQSSTSASPAPSNLIQGICGNRNLFSPDEETFCFNIIGTDDQANKAMNVVDLSIRGYQIAESNTTMELIRINELAWSETARPDLKQALRNCVVAFGNIVGAYHDSQEIRKSNCTAADWKIFGILDQISACEDSLKSQAKEVVDPFVWTSLQDAAKFVDLTKAITDVCPKK